MDIKKLHQPQKLTKKFFLSLPTGVYLVSNCYEMVSTDAYTPAFYEYVVASDQREAQWQRIKAAGANHRLCIVYRTTDEFTESLRRDTERSTNYPRFVLVEKEKDSDTPKT